MEPRINVITLAVEDLDRSMAFYRDGLGLHTEGLIGTEFKGDETTPDGAIRDVRARRRPVPRARPRAELAKDARVPPAPGMPGGFSIGHAVARREDVDGVMAQAEAAGASVTDPPHDRPWGIYSGYFMDPDDHLWEILWNPALDLVGA